MEANLKRVGELSVIVISGQLEIEQTLGFKKVCIEKFKGKSIAFNLEKASFVGSTGIGPFLETVESLSTSGQITIVGAKSEFRRILEGIQTTQQLSFVDNETQLLP